MGNILNLIKFIFKKKEDSILDDKVELRLNSKEKQLIKKILWSKGYIDKWIFKNCSYEGDRWVHLYKYIKGKYMEEGITNSIVIPWRIL